MPTRQACYQQAWSLYGRGGDRAKEAYMLKMLADFHYQQGNVRLAFQELRQTLAGYRAAQYPRLHYTYDLLASVSQRAGNYQQALGYELAAIESAKRTRDTTDLGLFYYKMGAFNRDLKQWQNSQHYLRLALEQFRAAHIDFMLLDAASLISSNLIDQNKPKEALAYYLAIDKQYSPGSEACLVVKYYTLMKCYMALNSYPLAEQFSLKVLAIEEKNSGTNRASLAVYLRLARIYFALRQYDKAHLYLAKIRGRTTKSLLDKASWQFLKFRLDTLQGHYREALAHYQQYTILNDSIFNETASKQIASLQIQYDTKAKEQDIALLTKRNYLQLASIRQKEFQRNSFVVSATLLLLLTGVVYNRYRLKQQSNQQLEAKQAEINDKNEVLEQVLVEKDTLLEEKEWMMKEIHHRVKNNLQVISSILYSQAVYLRDPAARTAIRESQNRVQTMGLLHQHLYQGSGPSQVAMAPYLGDLARHLLQSFSRQESIRLKLDVADIALDMTLAVPIGLLLNEALTNVLKYAYPPGETGLVALHLRVQDQQCYLSLRDEGRGLPTDFDPTNSPTLGWNMIQGLSRQLGAKLQITTTRGVQLDLQFASIVRARPSGLTAQA
ncbi:MAG: sensor histidine kinase [Janthinobacterium lividum]